MNTSSANGGFNETKVVLGIGYLTTIVVVLTPFVGLALSFVLAIVAVPISYGAYHEIARAQQNRKVNKIGLKNSKRKIHRAPKISFHIAHSL